MPDGPYPTPEESHFLRMLQESGSPEQAGMSLVQRLEALEAAVAELEARAQREAEEHGGAGEPGTTQPDAPTS